MYYDWIGAYGYAAYGEAAAAGAAAAGAERAASRAESALLQLQDQIDRQALLIRSLLVLMDKKGMTNEAEFRQLLEEVDLSDGRRDGKYRPQQTPRSCPKCQKTNSKRAVVCMYCGAPLSHEM